MARLLITAGPTHEPIDQVRYIANRSSGKLGVALAQSAGELGWDVTLLLGPAPVPEAQGIQVQRFTTTDDLSRLLEAHFPTCDALIMAAAVADYRPRCPAPTKIPRLKEGMTLELEPTPDLVAACAARKRQGQLIIGFALEPSTQLETNAAAKLRRKGLDAIVANPLETMSCDSITALVITAAGAVHRLNPMPKTDFARWLVAFVRTLKGDAPSCEDPDRLGRHLISPPSASPRRSGSSSH